MSQPPSARNFSKKAATSALPWSEARFCRRRVYYLEYAIDRREEAGQQDLLLPGRVGPGGRQAPDRLAALPRPGRRDRGPAVGDGPGRAGPHPPSRLRRPRRGVGHARAPEGRRDRRRGRRPRRADAAASVGTYIALATAQPGRATPARSSPFPSGGPRPPATGSCTFPPRRSTTGASGTRWTQISEASWPRSSAASSPAWSRHSRVDLSGLVLDMTNFATYIDSANDRAPIAQRGHAKQKRSDLRLVGLGLVVSTDGGIPLVSHAYARQPPRRHPVPHLSTSSSPASPRWPATWASSPSSSTPGRTQRTTSSCRGPAVALRRIAPTVGSPRAARRRPRLATGPSTRTASRGSAPSRPARSSSASSAASWSPTRRPCTTSSPGASTRPSPRPAASSPSSGPPRAGQDPQGPGKGRSRDRGDPQAPVALPGDLDHPGRREPRRPAPHAGAPSPRPATASKTSCSASASCSPTKTRAPRPPRSSPTTAPKRRPRPTSAR